jgi:hypothetical protein
VIFLLDFFARWKFPSGDPTNFGNLSLIERNFVTNFKARSRGGNERNSARRTTREAFFPFPGVICTSMRNGKVSGFLRVIRLFSGSINLSKYHLLLLVFLSFLVARDQSILPVELCRCPTSMLQFTSIPALAPLLSFFTSNVWMDS